MTKLSKPTESSDQEWIKLSHTDAGGTHPGALRNILNKSFGPVLNSCKELKGLLQDLGITINLPITFPRIVVCGGESAGKSSGVYLANYSY
jgi:hypothetical protein